MSELGQICKISGDCVKGLVCGQDDTCVAPKQQRDLSKSQLGQDCKQNGDCQKGLVCEKDTCLAPKSKRGLVSILLSFGLMDLANGKQGVQADVGLNKKCDSTDDCRKGLVCEKDLCIAPKNKRDVSKPLDNKGN